MRSNSRLILLCVLVAAFSYACKSKMLPASGAYQPPQLDANDKPVDRLLIHDFESMQSNWAELVNPYLYNLIMPVGGLLLNGTGAYMDRSYGMPPELGIRGAHMYGDLVDYGDGTFPSHQMRLSLKSGSTYYDMSFFSGIKFWMQLPNRIEWQELSYVKPNGYTQDKLMYWFNVYLRETTPTSDGGECDNSSGGCYNHFYVELDYTCMYPCGYGTGWVQKSFTWSQFARESWGNPVYPSTLSGDNLTEVILYEWQGKRNNVPGKSYTDISVDDVRFF